MADEVKDVKETPSTPSALESAIASSPEVQKELGVETQVQETETATPQVEATQEPVGQQEEGRVPYSRFKDVVEEKNYYRQLVEQQLQRQQPVVQQPTQNPYAGMTAEQEQYARWVDGRIEERATQIADAKVKQIMPIIEAGSREIAKLGVREFRRTFPDVVPNSPEEVMIADKIQHGYLADDAYWAVMGPRGIKKAEQTIKQQVKQQNVAKKMANVETTPSVKTPPIIETSRTVPKTRAEIEERERLGREKFRAEFEERWTKSQL